MQTFDTLTSSAFAVRPLPYDYNALEPYISAETLHLHHDKHYEGYVTKLNALVADTIWADRSLKDIILTSDGPLFNNAAQTWNHQFFFEQLAPVSEAITPAPEGRLREALIRDFGSVEQFREDLEQAAVSIFGSGWAWLAVDRAGKLFITKEQNAGNPMCRGMYPLLTIDVWEHAYYVDYRNRRAEFVKAVWSCMNWSVVAERYHRFSSK